MIRPPRLPPRPVLYRADSSVITLPGNDPGPILEIKKVMRSCYVATHVGVYLLLRTPYLKPVLLLIETNEG